MLNTLLNWLLKLPRSLIATIFDRFLSEDAAKTPSWAMEAHYSRVAQEPLRARTLLYGTALTVVGLIIWANFAQVDEVTRGEAKVVPSRQLQVIQSLDGGIVSEILVREGQIIEEGQILIRIDDTRFASSLRESRSQYLALLAKTERLAAIAEGRAFQIPQEVESESPDTAKRERRLYNTSMEELNSQIQIASQQLDQRKEQLVEAKALYEQANRSHEFAVQELRATEPLVDSGAVSEVEVLRLQRDVSRLLGEKEAAAAQIKGARAAIAEAESKIEQVELDFRNDIRNELVEAMAKLNGIVESAVGLSDKVKQAEVRSPVRGTVKRLMVNTVGGVVLPGRDIIEIVPLDDTLLLEAKISPRDIAFLRPGQDAMVKFTAYDFVIYGGLEAELESIGADTITDDEGRAFYIVKVRTFESSLGDDLPIIPGMVAEVDILTGQKSILTYLIKPVMRAKQYALTER